MAVASIVELEVLECLSLFVELECSQPKSAENK